MPLFKFKGNEKKLQEYEEKMFPKSIFKQFNYYEILGLKRDATDKQIKKSIKNLKRNLDPDNRKFLNEQMATKVFHKLENIENTLTNPIEKKKYDKRTFDPRKQGARVTFFKFFATNLKDVHEKYLKKANKSTFFKPSPQRISVMENLEKTLRDITDNHELEPKEKVRALYHAVKYSRNMIDKNQGRQNKTFTGLFKKKDSRLVKFYDHFLKDIEKQAQKSNIDLGADIVAEHDTPRYQQ